MDLTHDPPMMCDIMPSVWFSWPVTSQGIFCDIIVSEVWIHQIAKICLRAILICLVCLLNLHSHLSDDQGRQRSWFLREKESWGNLACISDIWLFTSTFWGHQLKKVEHFGEGAMPNEHRHLQLARSGDQAKNGPLKIEIMDRLWCYTCDVTQKVMWGHLYFLVSVK